MNSPSDPKSLAAQWNAAFVENSQPLWASLLRFAHAFTKGKTDADDILQSALLRALKAFPKFVTQNYGNGATPSEKDLFGFFQTPQFKRHFKNWLYKIVRNVAIDELAVVRWDDEEWDPDSVASPPSGGEFQGAIEEKEFYKWALDDDLKKRMEALNPKQRSVLYLASEDYSYKEISAILGMPMGTVMSTLSRAIAKLTEGQKSALVGTVPLPTE